MSDSKIGEVTTPSGGVNYVFWDPSSGVVLVGSESAGTASTKSEAMQKANYYATTGRKMT